MINAPIWKNPKNTVDGALCRCVLKWITNPIKIETNNEIIYANWVRSIVSVSNRNVNSDNVGPNEARLRSHSSASKIGMVQFLMNTSGDLSAFLQLSTFWLSRPRNFNLSLVNSPPVGFSTLY